MVFVLVGLEHKLAPVPQRAWTPAMRHCAVARWPAGFGNFSGDLSCLGDNNVNSTLKMEPHHLLFGILHLRKISISSSTCTKGPYFDTKKT